MNLADLHKPFSPEKISWRVGPTNKAKTSGLALAYLDSRDVQERLDAVCGYGGWQSRFPHANGKTICEIGIKVGDEWVWKADGAGDTDMEAEKGAISSAFKRAAVHWGIGRYLYDLDSPWVQIEEAGKSYKIAEGEYAKLRALLSRGLPKEASVTGNSSGVGGGSGGSNTATTSATKTQEALKMTPAEKWASAELVVIRAAPTPASLKAWEVQHDTKMKKLKLADPGLYDAMLAAVDARAKALLV